MKVVAGSRHSRTTSIWAPDLIYTSAWNIQKSTTDAKGVNFAFAYSGMAWKPFKENDAGRRVYMI